MITISQLESEILTTEGVILKVIRKPFTKSYVTPPSVESYVQKYKVPLSDEKRVGVLTRRISELLPGVAFILSTVEGYPIRGRNMRMADVRKIKIIGSEVIHYPGAVV